MDRQSTLEGSAPLRQVRTRRPALTTRCLWLVLWCAGLLTSPLVRAEVIGHGDKSFWHNTASVIWQALSGGVASSPNPTPGGMQTGAPTPRIAEPLIRKGPAGPSDPDSVWWEVMAWIESIESDRIGQWRKRRASLNSNTLIDDLDIASQVEIDPLLLEREEPVIDPLHRQIVEPDRCTTEDLFPEICELMGLTPAVADKGQTQNKSPLATVRTEEDPEHITRSLDNAAFAAESSSEKRKTAWSLLDVSFMPVLGMLLLLVLAALVNYFKDWAARPRAAKRKDKPAKARSKSKRRRLSLGLRSIYSPPGGR